MAKDNRIKSLEEIIIEMGHDPKDPKGTQALIKNREEDLAALRKQMKLPPTLHPQTTEVAQQKEMEDVYTLLMRMNQRILDTEKALEEALQGKQTELSSRPPPLIPTISAPPTTVTTTTPPPASTSAADVSTSSATASVTTAVATQGASLGMEAMMKEIKALELQMIEIKETKENLAKIEASYDIKDHSC